MNFIPIETSRDILAYFGDEKKHWNTCIELTATVGFMSLPVLVRNFTFSGIFKVEVELTRKIPFMKCLSVSMLELPLVDFELEPLKTVDFMDIPYLSQFVKSIINSQLSVHLVTPNSVKVDLMEVARYKGKTVGVVHVHVNTLRRNEEEPVSIEIGVYGKKVWSTSERVGKDPIFKEGCYLVVTDALRKIDICLNG
jgi:Ca2+-dependent lipid-binding protein